MGTTADKVAALTLLLQESAVSNLRSLDELLRWVSKRSGARAVAGQVRHRSCSHAPLLRAGNAHHPLERLGVCCSRPQYGLLFLRSIGIHASTSWATCHSIAAEWVLSSMKAHRSLEGQGGC